MSPAYALQLHILIVITAILIVITAILKAYNQRPKLSPLSKMASFQHNITILRTTQDQENWYYDLRSGIRPKIWELIDLELKDPKLPEKSPLSKPMKPIFANFKLGAVKYANLSFTEQKSFMNV